VLDRAWPRRTALAVIAVVAGVAYGWQANRDSLETYYAAAVRSMSANWHDFLFGSFDPAGTITLDKLPGAFWVQALAVRAFGVHTWVLIAPQAVEGVLTVLVLYHAVSRLAGPAAGLIAALVLTVSPATVALNRGNISDSLMILLLVLAADATSGAILAEPGRGRWWRLLLAGFWVGLAFQAKMIEAWLVLPAFGLAYLLDGRGPAIRRAGQLVAGGAVAAVVSLAWMTAVTLVPATSRPYADGSHDNSLFQQVFVYNGFGRLGEQTPLQVLAGVIRPGATYNVAAAGPQRLFTGDLGLDTGWLLLPAVAAGLWALASRVRRSRAPGDPLRAGLVLWGGWLLMLGVTFSVTTAVNPYYTAALSPAVAALLGIGLTMAWSAARSDGTSGRAQLGLRLGVAAIVAATTGYAAWRIPATGTHVPGWLVPAAIVAGIAAVVALLASILTRAPGRFGLALAVALVSALVVPTVASVGLVQHGEGALDVPFEPARLAQGVDSGRTLLTRIEDVSAPDLEDAAVGERDLAATQTSAVAADFIYATGDEVLPIGGFTGTIPSPTLGQLQADIRDRRFRTVIAFSTHDPRLTWIARHCLRAQALVFSCSPADAGAAPAGAAPANRTATRTATRTG
jgi:4-amino-4-deoxy-L-arabinose transferase-like glycosyltransferase